MAHSPEQGNGANRSSDCNIYIHSLPPEINDEKLVQIFGTFGDIESARVMVDFNTRVSKGYGFVKFRTADAAQNAIQTMHGFQLGSKTLVVKPANESAVTPGYTPSNNIYVKGLPVTVTIEQLKQAFARYGEVTECRILADFNTGISRGQALVRFEETTGASAAISALDNVPFPVPGNVKPLSVKYADSEEEKADRRTKIKKKLSTQRFLPYQNSPAAPSPPYTDPATIYAQYYHAYGVPPPPPEMFAHHPPPYPSPPHYNYQPHHIPMQHGPPQHHHLSPQHHTPQHHATQHPPPQYNSTPHTTSNGHRHPVPPSSPYQSGPLLQGVQSPSTPISAQGMSGQDPNVYVYHLPPETDDSHIYQRFGKYGAIQSVKVARDPGGVCKGYGFIRYAAMDSAMGAITNENGQRVGSKVLSVSLAKPKGPPGNSAY